MQNWLKTKEWLAMGAKCKPDAQLEPTRARLRVEWSADANPTFLTLSLSQYLCPKTFDYDGLYLFKNCTMSTAMGLNFKRQKLSGESSLIIQAAIICAVLQCQTIGFNLLPIFSRLLPSSAGIWLNVVQNWMVICSISVQPIVHFTFNTQIRKQTRDLLKIRFKLSS
ncbi:hypothetical protein Tcan_08962 [Toxocara canis]|uniref:Uncharacterized protein n=1 Tax=Toxocara canis TaxID=6265 RepID=A0A0B2VM23_TOXCA|nr:hypothetical protein Tcan_08962 [Toxocara canis]